MSTTRYNLNDFLRRIGNARRPGVHVALLFALQMLGLFSCNKKGIDQADTPTGVTLPACRLTDEERTGSFGYQHYWYTYTAERKVDSIYYSEYAPAGHSAPVAFCQVKTGSYLWKTYQNVTANSPPETHNFEYTGHTLDSSAMPSGLETNFTLFDGITTPSDGFSFDYTANGLLNGYYHHNGKPGTGIEYAMGAQYDDKGDVSGITWNVITGPRLTASVKVTGYDGHPNPWAGSIATYVFINPSIGWFSSEYDNLLFALSAHNPTGSIYYDGPDKLWEEAYSYEYNTNGQPTARTMVRTATDGGTLTVKYSYTYACP